MRFDVIVGRNVLTRHPEKAAGARVIALLLRQGGRLSLAEVVPRYAQRLYQLVDLSPLDEAVRQRLIASEEAIFANPEDPMVNWDADDLEAAFAAAGLSEVHGQVKMSTVQQHISSQHLARWFGPSADRQRPTYAQHVGQHLSADELLQVQTLFERQLRDQTVAWASQVVYLSAH